MKDINAHLGLGLLAEICFMQVETHMTWEQVIVALLYQGMVSEMLSKGDQGAATQLGGESARILYDIGYDLTLMRPRSDA